MCLPKNRRNAYGAAIGTTAANATSVPASVAEMDPAWQPYASTATAQCAVVQLYCFYGAMITAFLDKRMRKKKMEVHSEEAVRERELAKAENNC